jgi:hypothetical protein
LAGRLRIVGIAGQHLLRRGDAIQGRRHAIDVLGQCGNLRLERLVVGFARGRNGQLHVTLGIGIAILLDRLLGQAVPAICQHAVFTGVLGQAGRRGERSLLECHTVYGVALRQLIDDFLGQVVAAGFRCPLPGAV